MLFNSLTFLFLFFPLCLLVYFLFKNIQIKNIVLLFFSLVFYAWAEPVYILIMLLTILITYLFGFIIHSAKNKKFYFIISIIILVFNLFFFKYVNFFIDNVNYLFNIHLNNIKLVLPIGISFYTFQALSYLIDLYKGKIKIQKNFLSLALYISLFPQLIAGPIVRYESIEKEMIQRSHSLDDFVVGMKRFILGLSKKVILANSMGLIADTIFQEYNHYGTLLIWLAAISYTLQIYYDFSGYSDMAIGLGRIFGFHFLENFNYPYISKTITDFWRRWHISLSSWFKDYVYIPLGGSRVSPIKHVRNILIVWFLTGLWHGASWNYIIWGLYFAVFLLLEKYPLKNILKKVPNFLLHITTLFLIIISWVIFKTENLNRLLAILAKMFIYQKSNILSLITTHANLIFHFYLLLPALLFCVPVKRKKKRKLLNETLANILYVVLLIVNIIFIIGSTYNPFIYFRF